MIHYADPRRIPLPHSMWAKMACADCHQMDDERKYLKPINYENHCARCHALNVALVGDFAGELKQAAAAFRKTPLSVFSFAAS